MAIIIINSFAYTWSVEKASSSTTMEATALKHLHVDVPFWYLAICNRKT